MADVDYAALKKGGFMRQKQKGYFSLRLQVTWKPDLCINCGVCEKVCREGAITLFYFMGGGR